MLARSGRLPTGGDYAYELKWDGFRAIFSTEGSLRVRSRRGRARRAAARLAVPGARSPLPLQDLDIHSVLVCRVRMIVAFTL